VCCAAPRRAARAGGLVAPWLHICCALSRGDETRLRVVTAPARRCVAAAPRSLKDQVMCTTPSVADLNSAIQRAGLEPELDAATDLMWGLSRACPAQALEYASEALLYGLARREGRASPHSPELGAMQARRRAGLRVEQLALQLRENRGALYRKLRLLFLVLARLAESNPRSGWYFALAALADQARAG